VVAWLATTGCNAPADAEQGGGDLQSHVDDAANSVIAAAKEGVRSAASDSEAAERMQVAVEALRLIGILGDVDTEAQTEQLLDDLQSVGRPALVAEIITLRLAQQLQVWNQLDDASRQKTIERLIADVKQVGLSPDLAGLVRALAERLEFAADYELVSEVINELLPAFRDAADPGVQRQAPLLEGIVRRLPGNKLELEGELLAGGALDWESFRGKVVLVDFFASWCGPCREEVPNVLKHYRAYQDQGFTVVGVNMDENRAAAEGYVKQAGFDFPTLFSDDPQATGWDHPMGRKYGVTGLPRVILVDQEGVIVSAMARGQNLSVLLRKLLGEPSQPTDETTDTSEQDPDVAPASFEEEDDAAPEVVPDE
jgi:thiol-disulfide isomerase/thioredoxin